MKFSSSRVVVYELLFCCVGTQKSILNEESVTRVLRVFLSDRVEHGVKLTSLNQLAVILHSKSRSCFLIGRVNEHPTMLCCGIPRQSAILAYKILTA